LALAQLGRGNDFAASDRLAITLTPDESLKSLGKEFLVDPKGSYTLDQESSESFGSLFYTEQYNPFCFLKTY
jgi:hypothetical protein